VLFVNVPIGLAAAFVSPRLLPESRDEGPRVFDVAGATTVTAGLALFVYALVDANNAGWGSTQTIGLIAISVALLGAFILIERRTSNPLMPFSIFRLRTLRGADVVGLLIGMSLFGVFFFLSLYMQQVLVTRIGFKPTLIAGMLLVGGGLIWFAQVSPTGGYVSDVLFPSIILAWGLGLAFVPVTVAAVTGTRPDEAGLASGLINTAQQVGGALGLAILAAVANGRTSDVIASGVRNPAVALTEGFQDAFLVGAGFALLGAVLAAVMISSRDSREHAEAAQRGEAEPATAVA
jgi:MFS family permease